LQQLPTHRGRELSTVRGEQRPGSRVVETVESQVGQAGLVEEA
jgi:hypothetical protein